MVELGNRDFEVFDRLRIHWVLGLDHHGGGLVDGALLKRAFQPFDILANLPLRAGTRCLILVVGRGAGSAESALGNGAESREPLRNGLALVLLLAHDHLQQALAFCRFGLGECPEVKAGRNQAFDDLFLLLSDGVGRFDPAGPLCPR